MLPFRGTNDRPVAQQNLLTDLELARAVRKRYLGDSCDGWKRLTGDDGREIKVKLTWGAIEKKDQEKLVVEAAEALPLLPKPKVRDMVRKSLNKRTVSPSPPKAPLSVCSEV